MKINKYSLTMIAIHLAAWASIFSSVRAIVLTP